jgi:hypothetical protein
VTEEDRIERLLAGFEEAVLAAPDADIERESGEAAVAGIVAGVLKAYGYQRDGSRLPGIWRRERRLGCGPITRAGTRARVAQEPLRATFGLPSDAGDDDEGGNR